MRISLSDIGKQYGSHWIFRNIHQHFDTGQAYGIIGPNGSGKSSLLQIISGFVTPTSGNISYVRNQVDIPKTDWYQHLSIAAPYLELFDEFTVREILILQEQFKPFKHSTEQILGAINMGDQGDKPLSKLSSGMSQRLKLALAMYADSEVILLDEPCSNLDKKWMDWFNTTIQEIVGQCIVIIGSNSHIEELKHVTGDIIDLSVQDAH